MKRGDRFVAFPAVMPADRLFVTVTRVAKDGAWADIRVQNWACMWTKRQPLKAGGLPAPIERRDWTDRDLFEQMADWERKRKESAS